MNDEFRLGNELGQMVFYAVYPYEVRLLTQLEETGQFS